jgi:hypothetical protein
MKQIAGRFKWVTHNMIIHELKEFANDTSIHGIGQIANDKASSIKRLLWLGIFMGSLTYAGIMLKSSIEGTYRLKILIIEYFSSK